MSYSVLIVENNSLIRLGLKSAISQEAQLRLVGEAETISEGISALSSLHPDVFLVDLSTCESDADIDRIGSIRSTEPTTQVITFSNFEHDGSVHDAFRTAAQGYISSDASVEELLKGIIRVAEGGTYVNRAAADKLANRMLFDTLSRRELEILRLLSMGKSNKEIGRLAGISEETVKSHVNRILSKLTASSRTEAVAVALRRGMIKIR